MEKEKTVNKIYKIVKYLKIVLLLLWFSLPVTLRAQEVFVQYGTASYYDDKFAGRYTAGGEKYDPAAFTAAHLTLPFDTWVRVINLESNKSVLVRINDRGPFVQDRIIDVSKAAANELGMLSQGVVKIRIEKVRTEDVKVALPVVPEKKNESPTELKKTVEPLPNPSPVVASSSVTITTLNSEREFYEVQSSAATPVGYGVQIGSYKELVNLMRITGNIQNYAADAKVYVQVLNINDVKVYRVYVGSFSDRAKADALKDKLAGEFPDCFVVDFSSR